MRSGRGDHQHREEADRFTADDPGDQGHGQGHGGIDRAKLVAQPPQLRALRLGLAHDLHDLRIARVGRPPGGAEGQGRLAVDCARDHGGAGRLGNLERLAREVGFVHHAVALGHDAVRRADLVRINHKRVAHGDVRQRHLGDPRVLFPVGDGWHALGQRREHRRCAAQGVALQRLAAGEHEDDDGAGEIFAQQHRSDNGNAAEQIRAELPLQEFPQQLVQHRQSADHQHDQQRQPRETRSGVKSKAQHQVQQDARQGQGRDHRGLALPETREGPPRPDRRQAGRRIFRCSLHGGKTAERIDGAASRQTAGPPGASTRLGKRDERCIGFCERPDCKSSGTRHLRINCPMLGTDCGPARRRFSTRGNFREESTKAEAIPPQPPVQWGVTLIRAGPAAGAGRC